MPRPLSEMLTDRHDPLSFRMSPARDNSSDYARKCKPIVPLSCAFSIRPATLLLRRVLPVKNPLRPASPDADLIYQ